GRALGVVCALGAATGSEILYRGYLRVVAERVFRTWWTAAIVVSPCSAGRTLSTGGMGDPTRGQRPRVRASGARDRLALRRHPPPHVLRRAGLRGRLSWRGRVERESGL